MATTTIHAFYSRRSFHILPDATSADTLAVRLVHRPKEQRGLPIDVSSTSATVAITSVSITTPSVSITTPFFSSLRTFVSSFASITLSSTEAHVVLFASAPVGLSSHTPYQLLLFALTLLLERVATGHDRNSRVCGAVAGYCRWLRRLVQYIRIGLAGNQ